MNEVEEWRDIPGFEGHYQVSDRGRVRNSRGRVRKLQDAWGAGHLRVNLKVSGKETACYVHRLVLLAFEGPCPEGQQVRHLDGDPTNNSLANLKYGTPKENSEDTIRHGRTRNGKEARTHCPREHRLEEPNLTRSGVLQGYRRCLACNRAQGVLKRKGVSLNSEEFLQVSNRYYKEIMSKKEDTR